MVAQAQGRQATASGLEARAAKAEAKSAGILATSSKVLLSTRERAGLATLLKKHLVKLAEQASGYARDAEQASAKAEADLQEAMNAPQWAAMEAAKEAVAELQKSAKFLATDGLNGGGFELKDLDPTTPPPVMEPAQSIAMAPYYAAMQRAVDTRTTYDTEARKLAQEAVELRQAVRAMPGQ